MDWEALEVQLARFESDPSLDDESALASRIEALDFLTLLDQTLQARDWRGERADLRERSAALRGRLEGIDRRLFRRVREWILSPQCNSRDLRHELNCFTTYSSSQVGHAHFGYDALDVLLDGVWGAPAEPETSPPLPPEMIHYEPTPARVILDLVDHGQLGPDDVFFDLGSGLGQVALLVNLLTGIPSRGIEYQAHLWRQSERIAHSFGTVNVAFVCADARDADFSEGTSFFLFSPFKGRLLRDVLTKLRDEAQRRPISVYTYGPCTADVYQQTWLRSQIPDTNHPFKLAIFKSQ